MTRSINFQVGDYFAVIADSLEGMEIPTPFGGVRTHTPDFNGVPYKIIAICLPFIVYKPKGCDQPHTVDTRRFTLRKVTDEYAAVFYPEAVKREPEHHAFPQVAGLDEAEKQVHRPDWKCRKFSEQMRKAAEEHPKGADAMIAALSQWKPSYVEVAEVYRSHGEPVHAVDAGLGENTMVRVCCVKCKSVMTSVGINGKPPVWNCGKCGNGGLQVKV